MAASWESHTLPEILIGPLFSQLDTLLLSSRIRVVLL